MIDCIDRGIIVTEREVVFVVEQKAAILLALAIPILVSQASYEAYEAVSGMLDAGVFVARLRQPHWKRGTG